MKQKENNFLRLSDTIFLFFARYKLTMFENLAILAI
jgi:hypothetical protein